MLKMIPTIAGALGVLGLALSPALATGTYDGANSAWYSAQYNKAGAWCCDKADGHAYFGDYTLNNDGSVTLDPQGINRTLPQYMVLQGQNPTGHSVWWYSEGPRGHIDFCFAPGGGA